MNDQDVERVLRAAGARLRAGAPDDDATEEAWTRLLDRPPATSRWRWGGPALVLAAAAAAVVGTLILTRPSDSVRQIPATFPSDSVPPTTPASGPTSTGGPVFVTAGPTSSTTPSATEAAASSSSSSVAAVPPTAGPATSSTVAPATTPTTAPPTTAPSPGTTAATPTPAVTAAPTSSAVTTTTASVPAFAGDPPLSSSAAVVGCPGDLAEIAAATPAGHFPITALDCSPGTVQAVGAGGAVVVLERVGGGWQHVGPGDFTVAVPIPPAGVLAHPMGDIDPVDATAQVQAIDAASAGTDVAAFGQVLGAALADWTEPVPRITVDVAGGADVVFVSIDGLPDDSVRGVVYAVWYRVDGDRLTVLRAFQGTVCARGNDGTLCV